MNKAFSSRTQVIGTGIAAVFFAAAPLLVSHANAQERHERRDHVRERFQTPHWVFDDRFHHNHYYPSVGYSLSILPTGNIAVGFRGGRFFFHSGVWYQRGGPGFVVVRPPFGIVVPVLPPAYSTVWNAGVPYYYANDVYYAEQAGGGYVVSPPPMEATAATEQSLHPPAPAPQTIPAPGASAPPASASWYYCDSTNAYYPYVSECREGWRAVPANPPQAR